MAKLSGPLQEVSRLLDLVPFLSTHPYISLKSLSDEFGVSEKEMARELIELSMCGLPGYTPYDLIEVNFESGFVSIQNHEAIDIPRALSFSEIATLLIGLSSLKEELSGGSPEISQEVDRLIDRLTVISGGSIEAEVDETLNALAEIKRAIEERGVLRISYHSIARDEVRDREITPLRIYRENGEIYLSASCHEAHALRNFRVDRIRVLEVLPKSASDSKVSDDLDTSEGKKVVTLHLHSQPRALSESLGLAREATIGEVSMPIFSEEWLIRNLLAAGGDMEVLRDISLRASVSSKAAATLALYR